jgi:hypothetical protein
MIDQSNRAGKLNINGGETPDGQNLLCVPAASVSSPTTAKRLNYTKYSRVLPQNQKRLHRRTNSSKMPVTAAAVASRRSPLSYMTKGKSV